MSGPKLYETATLSAISPTRYTLPFEHLDVYHNVKFSPPELHDQKEERDIIKAHPTIKKTPARYDTAILIVDDKAESTGLQGKIIFLLNTSL
ncbi:hypothetical protein JAAARDRAFT_200474 [Jaapia argillacea MUCL 33604]|uniref:DUF6830 domain-containing protein n=1 Tax=Jaapia argillacea MUCL 33604 TaxID=933084 RepID=A0A067P4J1_9AGAM|nr:hypothetical protein JAAARDRAFT_200474 [Jaapia argillacea MUCL 33604]